MTPRTRVAAPEVFRWSHAQITAHALGYRATFPTPPSGNRSVRRGATHQYGSPAWDAYLQGAHLTARVWRPVCVEPPATVDVWVRWYRGRAAGDLDNRLKTGLDALQGILYRRDSQITRIEAVRLDGDAVPRIEVIVLPGVAA